MCWSSPCTISPGTVGRCLRCSAMWVRRIARVARGGPGWAPLAVQYVDYTLWQREYLGELGDPGSAIAGAAGFLGAALAGMPERLDLPTDRPYPLAADYRGALAEVAWPRAAAAGAWARPARQRTSFMVLQTALAVVLAKISASTDVAVGFSIADVVIPHSMSWSAFSPTRWCCGRCVRRSQRCRAVGSSSTTQPGRLEHQHVPFEALVERLNPTRSLTHQPLVQVMLAWQTCPGKTTILPSGSLVDLQVTGMPVDTRTARIDLAFSLGERWRRPVSPPGSADSGVSDRRVRRGQHRHAHRALAAGAGGDHRRPHPAAVVDRSARRRRTRPPRSVGQPGSV